MNRTRFVDISKRSDPLWATMTSMRRIVCLVAAASVACGSSNSGSAAPNVEDGSTGATATDAGQCPASLAGTVGVACQPEGLFCAPAYTCNLIQIPVLCTCAKGSFACTDWVGNRVDAGETPSCPGPVDASCPPSEKSATMAACSEVGLVCPYPSACDGGTDSCECMPGALVTGGPNLVFECQTTCVSSDGAAPDVEDGSAGPANAELAADAAASE